MIRNVEAQKRTLHYCFKEFTGKEESYKKRGNIAILTCHLTRDIYKLEYFSTLKCVSVFFVDFFKFLLFDSIIC